MTNTAQDAAQAILPIIYTTVLQDGVPYVTVSHSVGTLIQYELLSLMRERGMKMPSHVFVSSFPHPDIEPSLRPWKVNATLDDAAFKQECRDWDTNEIIFSVNLWPGLEPLMRADFTIFDQYEYKRAGEPRFDFPITAFVAKKDKKVTREMVDGWRRFTSAAFRLHEIDGHHLFPISVPPAKKVWLQTIVDAIESIEK